MGIPKRTFKGTATYYKLIFIPLLFLSSCISRNCIPDWITGEWTSSFNGIAIRETWVLEGDHLRGTTVWSSGKSRTVDRLKMYFDQKNRLVYEIKEPRKLLRYFCDDPYNDTLVFVNLAANFPKRLVYVQPKGTKMKVWVDNEPNDPNQVVFPFKKRK